MQISLNIILDVLQSFSLEKHVGDDNPVSFSKCLPLPDETGEFEPDCLYVGGLSKAIALCKSHPGLYCICQRDRIKDGFETGECLSGLIIVNENTTITALFTLIQNRFFEVISWIQQMHEALIKKATIQEIIDLCYPIIDNYIAVSDSSLMLMAYSRHIPCDDPICVALRTHGYFPEETIQIFRKYDLFKVWEMTDEAYIDDSLEIAKYPVYHKLFKFGRTYFSHVVMTCNHTPMTRSLIDLFNILIDVLSVCMERAWEEKNACNHIYDTFLTDLVEGTITDKAIIEERAQYVGIPLTGKFCLFQIVPNNAPNISIGKMLIEFSELFPRFRFIRYQQRIVAINHFYAKDIEDQLDTISQGLESFLEKYDALCGVSLFFTSLEEMQFTFQQSSLALKYAHHMRGSAISRSIRLQGDKESRIHYFSQKYVFCLLGENDANAELWYHSDYHEMLLKLYQHDERHKSNNLQLLHVYLCFERNATESAKALNMHRNNVTYHINRIQEMLQINLDDPHVRFMMLMSFFLLELYGFAGT